MYLDASSHNGARPSERRRNSRHRASSIIYAQLGSGNGGIVLNLGMDGVAFQAAMKLTAAMNSTVNLRLRGSGLNAELVGELVWLGGTQKQAGICFKGVSADVQKDIADWIAREEQDPGPDAPEDRLRAKPTAPAHSMDKEKSASHSSTSAIPMSRPMPADSPAYAKVSEPSLRAASDPTAMNLTPAPILGPMAKPAPAIEDSPNRHSDVPAKPFLEALLDSATKILGSSLVLEPANEPPAPKVDSPIHHSDVPAKLPLEEPLDSAAAFEPAREIVSPIRHFDVPVKASFETALDFATELIGSQPALQPAAELVSPTQHSDAPEQGQGDEPLFNHLIFDRPAIDRPHESPTHYSSADVLPRAAKPQVRELSSHATPESVGKNEAGKTEEIKPIPQERPAQPASTLAKHTLADGWIPPAFLVAWRQANPQRRVVLATSGAALLIILPVILIAAMAHVNRPMSRPLGTESVRGYAAKQATASLSFDFPQAGPLPAPRAPHNTIRPQPDPLPPPTFFDTLAKDVLGVDPPKPEGYEEPVVWPEITDAQVVVQVWTSKFSGYYFCADSPYITTEQPGAFMSQGDALQTGYQPILGTFCN